MEHHRGAAAGAAADLGVANVPLHQLDAVREMGEVRPLAGGQVVQHPHPRAALHQGGRQVRADEPGTAGDEDETVFEFAVRHDSRCYRLEGRSRTRPSTGSG